MKNRLNGYFFLILILFLVPFGSSLGIYDSYQNNQNPSRIDGFIENIYLEIYNADDYLVYYLQKNDTYSNTCNLVSDFFIKRFSFKNEIYFLVNKDKDYDQNYVEIICDDYKYNNTFILSELQDVSLELKNEIDDLISDYSMEYYLYMNNMNNYNLANDYFQLFIINEDFFLKHKYEINLDKEKNLIKSRSLNSPNSNDYVYCDWADNEQSNSRCYYARFAYDNYNNLFVGYYSGTDSDYHQLNAIASGGTNVYKLNIPMKDKNDDLIAQYSANFVLLDPNTGNKVTTGWGYEIQEVYNYCDGDINKPLFNGNNEYRNDELKCNLDYYKYHTGTAKIMIYADYKHDGYEYKMSSNDPEEYEEVYLECVSDSDCFFNSGNTCKLIENGYLNTIKSECSCEDTSSSDNCLDLSNGNICDGDSECKSEVCSKSIYESYYTCKSCADVGDYASDEDKCCNGLIYDKYSKTCVECSSDRDCLSDLNENKCNGDDLYFYYTDYYCEAGECKSEITQAFDKDCSIYLDTNTCDDGECVCIDGIYCDRCLNLENGKRCECDSECNSNICSRGKCISDPVCGDGICHNNEKCVYDCIEINYIDSDKTYYEQGENVKISFSLRNKGESSQTFLMTTGVIPHSWEGNYVYTSSDDSLNCEFSKSFFSRETLKVYGDSSKEYSYNVNVPNRNSIYNGNNVLDEDMVAYVDLGGCRESYRVYSSTFINANQCNNNGKCETDEDFSNCRNDCPCNYNNICELEYENSKNCRNDCSCDNNGQCEFNLGETFSNCQNDCKCDNDGICELFQGENEETCVSDCGDCDFLDGSSYRCDCDFNSDCDDGYYCNQVSGPDACEEIDINDECLQYNEYYCEGNEVLYCGYNGVNYEPTYIEKCDIENNFICNNNTVAGLGKCEKIYKNFQSWIDFAPPETKVYKQFGDKFILNIESDVETLVDLTYNESVFSSNCKNGRIYVEDLIQCEFDVDYLIGEHEINVAGKVLKIEIVRSFNSIYITDSKKLYERFQNEGEGVDALLRETYVEAEENKGIVYDLVLYDLDENPFHNYFEYNEEIVDFKLENNSYAFNVASFIQEKIIGGVDVVVVGDDFVVPYYRRKISSLEKELLFFNNEKEYEIYTDVGLIKSEKLTFSGFYEMFLRDDKYEGKPVTIILPENLSKEQRVEIDNLKKIFMNTNYKPKFSELNSSEVYCIDESWVNKVRRSSLIIIGTEENNRAFNCMPFVAGIDNRNMAFIQPNIWNNKEYSIIINTNEPGVIDDFSKLVLISNEESGLINIKSNAAYIGHKTAVIAGDIALATVGIGIAASLGSIAGLGSIGAAAGSISIGGTVWAIAKIIDIPTDVVESADACFFDGKVLSGNCIGTVSVSFAFSEANERIIKKIKNLKFVKKFFSKLDTLLGLYKKYGKKIDNYFGEKVLKKYIRNNDDLYIYYGLKRFDGASFNKIRRNLNLDKSVDDILLRKNQEISFLYRQGLNDELFDTLHDMGKQVDFSKFKLDPDFTKRIDLTNNILLVKNKADGGIIAVNKNTKEIITNMNEFSYDEYLNERIRLDNLGILENRNILKNAEREIEMQLKLESDGLTAFLHTNNIRSDYIDVIQLEPGTNRIRGAIYNTGGRHTPEQIATKLQKMRNDGFKFGSGESDEIVDFYYDSFDENFDTSLFFNEVSDDNRYLKILDLQDDFGTDTITFLEDGHRITIRFKQIE